MTRSCRQTTVSTAPLASQKSSALRWKTICRSRMEISRGGSGSGEGGRSGIGEAGGDHSQPAEGEGTQPGPAPAAHDDGQRRDRDGDVQQGGGQGQDMMAMRPDLAVVQSFVDMTFQFDGLRLDRLAVVLVVLGLGEK